MPADTNTGGNYKWLAFLTVSIGTFMGTLDASIVNIALPRLTSVFNSDSSTVLWVSVAYLLTSCSLMLSLGKLGDTLGKKRIYTLGYAIFTVGLVLCSLSQSITQLIMFRVIQGIGSAMTISLGMAIATASFPAAERGKALGMLASVVSIGLLTGPVLGGVLVDSLDWRSIFYLRIPVGILGLVMAWLILKDDRAENVVFKFDFIGTATLFGGLASLLLFFNFGGRMGFLSPLILGLGTLAILCFTLFVVFEKRAVFPIVDLSLFRSRLFAGGNIGLGIMFLAQANIIFLLPFYLIQGLGYSASKSGLLMAIPALVTLLVGPLSGWLSDRIGSRSLCILGSVLTVVSLFLLSGLDAESGYTDISLRMALFGTGIGVFYPPNNNSIMGSVSRQRLGSASAMLATMRQVGMSTGVAIAGTIFASRQLYYSQKLSGEIASQDLLGRLSLINGFQDTLVIAGFICLIAVLASFARGK
ncbi:MFS transporter [Chloroflexota bacterium]